MAPDGKWSIGDEFTIWFIALAHYFKKGHWPDLIRLTSWRYECRTCMFG